MDLTEKAKARVRSLLRKSSDPAGACLTVLEKLDSEGVDKFSDARWMYLDGIFQRLVLAKESGGIDVRAYRRRYESICEPPRPAPRPAWRVENQYDNRPAITAWTKVRMVF